MVNSPPCPECGGKYGHVPGCGIGNREAVEREAFAQSRAEERGRERDRMLAESVGKTIAGIRQNPGFSIRFDLSDGSTIAVDLAGGELDGHGDPPGNRFLRVERQVPAGEDVSLAPGQRE